MTVNGNQTLSVSSWHARCLWRDNQITRVKVRITAVIRTVKESDLKE